MARAAVADQPPQRLVGHRVLKESDCLLIADKCPPIAIYDDDSIRRIDAKNEPLVATGVRHDPVVTARIAIARPISAVFAVSESERCSLVGERVASRRRL